MEDDDKERGYFDLRTRQEEMNEKVNLREQVGRIATRSDLARFISELRADLRANSRAWENESLESYLEAASAWLNDTDSFPAGRCGSTGECPTWSDFGRILLAAKFYE